MQDKFRVIMNKVTNKEFISLNIAVVTFSDTRTFENDTSGKFLEDSITKSGHNFIIRKIVREDINNIRNTIEELLKNNPDVIITTGGTGFTSKDLTHQALFPLLTKHITGFGELFRHLSYLDIGSATIQSNAFAGFIGKVMLFCLPGSTGACKLAWQKILELQLNSTTNPCNLVTIVKNHL